MVRNTDGKIRDIIQRTHNVKSFRVEVEGDIQFKAGQFLQVTLKTEGRPWQYLTISNSPTEEGYIEFTKKLTDSDFSKALGVLRPGDVVEIKYPFGTFTFEGKFEKIAFLSGGIGITPIRSICKYIVDKKLDTDIVLVYANKTIRDIAFMEDFERMRQKYSKLKVVHVLSAPDSDWKGRSGHINSQVVREESPDYSKRRFYICGPPAMVEGMKKMLLDELALPKDNICTENFTGY